jgi:hypothetical protein
MKIISKNPKLALSALLFLSFTAVLTSCSKDNSNTGPNGTAHVMIVNSIEGSSSQDLYLNNAKINTSAVAYGQATDYFSAASGNPAAQFKDSGTTTINASANISLQANNYYTVYYAGSDTAKTCVVTQNDQTAPPSGFAKVRFLQLSSAAAKLADFGISDSTKLVTNLVLRTASAYYNVNSNTKFSLYAAGSSTVLLGIPTTVQAGKIYTVYISGSTALTLSAHVITEN